MANRERSGLRKVLSEIRDEARWQLRGFPREAKRQLRGFGGEFAAQLFGGRRRGKH